MSTHFLGELVFENDFYTACLVAIKFVPLYFILNLRSRQFFCNSIYNEEILLCCKCALGSSVIVFTESAPRQIQSESCDVRLWVCLCVCPLPVKFILRAFLPPLTKVVGHFFLDFWIP